MEKITAKVTQMNTLARCNPKASALYGKKKAISFKEFFSLLFSKGRRKSESYGLDDKSVHLLPHTDISLLLTED